MPALHALRALSNLEYRHHSLVSTPHLDFGSPTAVKPRVWPTDFEPLQPMLKVPLTDGAQTFMHFRKSSQSKTLITKLCLCEPAPAAADRGTRRPSDVAQARPARLPWVHPARHPNPSHSFLWQATKKHGAKGNVLVRLSLKTHCLGASCSRRLRCGTAALFRRLLCCRRSRGLAQALPRRRVQLRAASHGQLQPVLELRAAPLASAHQLSDLSEGAHRGGQKRGLHAGQATCTLPCSPTCSNAASAATKRCRGARQRKPRGPAAQNTARAGSSLAMLAPQRQHGVRHAARLPSSALCAPSCALWRCSPAVCLCSPSAAPRCTWA